MQCLQNVYLNKKNLIGRDLVFIFRNDGNPTSRDMIGHFYNPIHSTYTLIQCLLGESPT